MEKKYFRVYTWDLVGLERHIKRELIPELCDKGSCLINYYVLWNNFGLGTYDRQFKRKCDAVLRSMFKSLGLDVSIRHKRNGYGVIRVRV